MGKSTLAPVGSVSHHALRQHPALPYDQRRRGRQRILAVVRQPDLVHHLRRIEQPCQLALLFVVQVAAHFRRRTEREFQREDVLVGQRELGNRQHHPLAPLEAHSTRFCLATTLVSLARFSAEYGQNVPMTGAGK
jgi:hypothetical protein